MSRDAVRHLRRLEQRAEFVEIQLEGVAHGPRHRAISELAALRWAILHLCEAYDVEAVYVPRVDLHDENRKMNRDVV